MAKQYRWRTGCVLVSLAWAGLSSCQGPQSSAPSPTVPAASMSPTVRPSSSNPSPANSTASLPSPPNPTQAGQPFPNQLVQDFIGGCTAAGVSAAACRCTITQIQQTYSYDQFTEINQAMGRGIPAPESFSKIVASCKQAQ
jgi:hypothetical protein